MDKRVKFMAKLPPDLHRWLKITAAERGIDMNEILVAALDSARVRMSKNSAEKREASDVPSDH